MTLFAAIAEDRSALGHYATPRASDALKNIYWGSILFEAWKKLPGRDIRDFRSM